MLGRPPSEGGTPKAVKFHRNLICAQPGVWKFLDQLGRKVSDIEKIRLAGEEQIPFFGRGDLFAKALPEPIALALVIVAKSHGLRLCPHLGCRAVLPGFGPRKSLV